MIKAVLFDMIGTTVIEKDPQTINNCFLKAFADNNVTADINLFRANRGKDKLEIINLILRNTKQDVSIAESVFHSFKKNVEDNLENFSAAKDALNVFDHLRQRSIKIGLGTGLPKDVFEKITERIQWGKKLFDYIGIAAEIGKSRPDPAMIHDMMNKCNIQDPAVVLKVGDTIVDIQEGKNANVITAVILAGTQTRVELEKENPDFIFTNLAEILNIIDK